MITMNSRELVNKEFDFGWKRGLWVNKSDLFVFKHQKGDILDVGCGTGQIYKILKQQGWNGQYIGIDLRKYDNYEYPDDIELIIADAFEVPFPEVDTVILHNILEIPMTL